MHILLAEDDSGTRRSIASVLESAGYRVTAAHDGETAIALLTQTLSNGQSYDLVITDLKMGLIDGIEVLHTAARQAYAPEVIILTGYGTLDTAIAALRFGAYDYLLKPCKPRELLDCVARALERRRSRQDRSKTIDTISKFVAQLHAEGRLPEPLRPQQEHANNGTRSVLPAQTLQVGKLVIDSANRLVFFDGQQLHVTPIEYQLLYCLAAAGGQVRTYLEIVEQTHGCPTSEQDAHMLLKPHIRNVRRKLPGGYIVTVRSIGYRMGDPGTMHR